MTLPSKKLIYALCITVVSFQPIFTFSQSNLEITRDQVAFDSVMSDSEISTLINSYEVKPNAVFMMI